MCRFFGSIRFDRVDGLSPSSSEKSYTWFIYIFRYLSQRVKPQEDVSKEFCNRETV